jgi:hypothetical protein
MNDDRIVCLNTKVVYDSPEELAKLLGIGARTIRRILRNNANRLPNKLYSDTNTTPPKSAVYNYLNRDPKSKPDKDFDHYNKKYKMLKNTKKYLESLKKETDTYLTEDNREKLENLYGCRIRKYNKEKGKKNDTLDEKLLLKNMRYYISYEITQNKKVKPVDFIPTIDKPITNYKPILRKKPKD